MKLDRYIDDFIRKEKEVEVNPYLTTRVLAELEKQDEAAILRTTVPIWKKAVVAASIVLVMAAGYGLGSMVKGENEHIAININDAQLENLNLYTAIGYEWKE